MSVTIIFIVITAAVSFAAFNNNALLDKLLLWPYRMRHPLDYYRLLTAGFVHADTMHLAFNMFSFYFFGEMLEESIGSTNFIICYLAGIIVASVPSLLKKRNQPNYRSLGASGGVAAIIFASIYIQPWSRIYLFMVIKMPSIAFAIVYIGYTAYLARKGKGVVNHDAHLWGAIFGFLFMLVIDPTHGQYFLQELRNIRL